MKLAVCRLAASACAAFGLSALTPIAVVAGCIVVDGLRLDRSQVS